MQGYWYGCLVQQPADIPSGEYCPIEQSEGVSLFWEARVAFADPLCRLFLEHNELESLPDCIGQLTNLTTLVIVLRSCVCVCVCGVC